MYLVITMGLQFRRAIMGVVSRLIQCARGLSSGESKLFIIRNHGCDKLVRKCHYILLQNDITLQRFHYTLTYVEKRISLRYDAIFCENNFLFVKKIRFTHDWYVFKLTSMCNVNVTFISCTLEQINPNQLMLK